MTNKIEILSGKKTDGGRFSAPAQMCAIEEVAEGGCEDPKANSVVHFSGQKFYLVEPFAILKCAHDAIMNPI